MQIYIKEEKGFYLTYIPDAKAFTDAPESLVVLIKQRRRWMNGALFAAWRIIFNFMSMISADNNSRHPYYRRIGMFVYLIYFLGLQIFSLFIVGSFYVSIKFFFAGILKEYVQFDYYWAEWFFQGPGFSMVFSYFYIVMLMFTLFISMGAPLDLGMCYFKFIAFIISLLTITSLAGIGFFLYEVGFWPYEEHWDKEKDKYIRHDI